MLENERRLAGRVAGNLFRFRGTLCWCEIAPQTGEDRVDYLRRLVEAIGD